ncbi:hypothetical protein [Glycomyces paridis]|uniref:Uncharacterized protein n=1 Tax=Glycomyces paridis TaxID=2126555 RepID=A0A4S8PC71_9ACTN|nr:hypothetical protein [Glycomyces paridis]THV27917.1 hypothetical protein E9998_13070 [Glycomyces paridis]
MVHTDSEQIHDSRTRFARETAQHELTIIHDDGPFRHLRFARPGSSGYWVEITTVPGALVFRGDGDTWTFARTEDMFAFFRGDGGSINPQYWAEKITDGRDRARHYDEDAFRRVVLEEFSERLVDGEIPLDRAGEALTRLARGVLDDETVADEAEARAALERFEFPVGGVAGSVARFADTWEWDFTRWDWWYLWACHAIVHVIKLYDQAKACPECQGECGTHNTTVIADTNGGTASRRSCDPKATVTVATTGDLL